MESLSGASRLACSLYPLRSTRLWPKNRRQNGSIERSMNPTNVVDLIKEGVMIGPASQQTAEIERKYTNRQMPW